MRLPGVLGIINLSADTFHAPSRVALTRLLDTAQRMRDEGAMGIDIGAEATNPYRAAPITAAQEYERIMPALEAVCGRFDGLISVDTSQPKIISAALSAGVHIINDVRALRLPGALEAVTSHPRAHEIIVCVMHMQGLDFKTMQQHTAYQQGLIPEIQAFLQERVDACRSQGLHPDHIWIDPGIGFGKTPAQCWQIIDAMSAWLSLGQPVLIGLSRKSFFAYPKAQPSEERLIPTTVAHTLVVQGGAHVIRAHDVREAKQVIDTLAARSALLAEEGL